MPAAEEPKQPAPTTQEPTTQAPKESTSSTNNTVTDASGADKPTTGSSATSPQNSVSDNANSTRHPDVKTDGADGSAVAEAGPAAGAVDTVAQADKSEESSLSIIPPSDKGDEASGAPSAGDASEQPNDAGLTVLPSTSVEAVAQDDALAQTGAAQLLVTLGIVLSLGVIGATLVIARRQPS
ncbi:hypothetical protein C7K25_08035 [Gulosibacter molinativorax]|uniref:Gram-positive cocci surface proteins LPxTG domain-containing protein n=2 Tax=Gulosibacter molinativorax TaxID=256821 RepID=A0ABT7C7U8_9MICO|nr:hypothetical protein [Gulosibacter molinativorax]